MAGQKAGEAELAKAECSLGGGRPIPSSCPNYEDYEVTFDPCDHTHPQNWTTGRKYGSYGTQMQTRG